jgi:hypothetical protein
VGRLSDSTSQARIGYGTCPNLTSVLFFGKHTIYYGRAPRSEDPIVISFYPIKRI